MNPVVSSAEKDVEFKSGSNPHDVSANLHNVDLRIQEVADELTDRQAHLGIDQELTPEELETERAFVRKVDWQLMPLLLITYGVQYADKISLSSGVAFDLRRNTGLVGNDFAWLSTGFYLAYLIFEFPFAWLMQRYPLDKVLAIAVVGWGVCVLCLAACTDFVQLMAVRTLLGILESPINPGFLIIITAWYKREEQSIRSIAFFAMNSFFSLFILMMNYGVGKAAVGSSIASWKAINLFLGALSFFWGLILFWRLCTPKNASWLSAEEKAYAHARLVRNKTGESTSGIAINWSQVWEAARDPQVYFLMFYTFFGMAASGGFSTFSTIILQSFGLDVEQTISYQLPWYAFQFVGCCIMGYVVNRYPNRNLNITLAATFLVPPIVGIFLEGLLPNTKKWGRLIGFWITGTYTPAFFVMWCQTSHNVAGRTKKSTVQALTFTCWCLGFVVGPQTFQAKDAPQYRPGLYFCCACFVVAELTLIAWLIWVRWENKRRDKRSAAMGITPDQAALEGCLFGLQDMTDKQVGVKDVF
ncbi:major facilitator superfamily domain-containing protein [Naematelia encephala]|uniref:Major facilitator superfamily domain-containing protein n=1 Tax=Naematelia encephala TaxID=71784 RepID=A0A1Y2ASK0_9TREE|nr:major facilitator superfamily domain-containing protein [Naematelia encephala]